MFTPIEGLIGNHDCSTYQLKSYDMPSEFILYKFIPEGYQPYQALLHPRTEVDCAYIELSLDESMECEPSEDVEIALLQASAKPSDDPYSEQEQSKAGLAGAKPAEDQESEQERSKAGLAGAKPAEDQESEQERSKKGLAGAKPAEDQESEQERSKKGLAGAKPAEDQESEQERSKKGLAGAKPAEDQESEQERSKKGLAGAKPAEDQESEQERSKKGLAGAKPAEDCSQMSKVSKSKQEARIKKKSDLESSKSSKNRENIKTPRPLPQLNWSRGLKPSQYFFKRSKPAKIPYDAKLHKHTMNFARSLDAKLGFDKSVRSAIYLQFIRFRYII